MRGRAMIMIVSMIILIVAAVSGYVLFKYKNQRPRPDYFNYYKNQDRAPVGKVGVFATSLIMTEDHDHTMFHHDLN